MNFARLFILDGLRAQNSGNQDISDKGRIPIAMIACFKADLRYPELAAILAQCWCRHTGFGSTFFQIVCSSGFSPRRQRASEMIVSAKSFWRSYCQTFTL